MYADKQQKQLHMASELSTHDGGVEPENVSILRLKAKALFVYAIVTGVVCTRATLDRIHEEQVRGMH